MLKSSKACGYCGMARQLLLAVRLGVPEAPCVKVVEMRNENRKDRSITCPLQNFVRLQAHFPG